MKYNYYYNLGEMVYNFLAFIAKKGKQVFDKLLKKYSYSMRRKHIIAVNERYRIHK